MPENRALSPHGAHAGLLEVATECARLVQADEHLLAAVRYVVRNSVRAGLCRVPEE